MTMSTLLWILGIGAFFYFMRKSGGGCCGSHSHDDNSEGVNHDNQESEADTEVVPKKLETSSNTSTKDPVCSMHVDNSEIVRHHFGRTFHFCSDKCRKIFDLNPNKYVETYSNLRSS